MTDTDGVMIMTENPYDGPDGVMIRAESPYDGHRWAHFGPFQCCPVVIFSSFDSSHT